MAQTLIALSPEELQELVRSAVREAMGQQKAPPKKTYWDAFEVAEHFGVSRSTVTNWLREGCPHHCRGNVLRFELPAVDAWFRARPKK